MSKKNVVGGQDMSLQEASRVSFYVVIYLYFDQLLSCDSYWNLSAEFFFQ